MFVIAKHHVEPLWNGLDYVEVEDMEQFSYRNRDLTIYDDYRSDFTVIDIETTGLSPEDDYIIEVAAVRFRNGIETESFSSLIKPPISIPVEASIINNIWDNMVQGAPDADTVMPKFFDFISEDMIVGHNIASFDINFLRKFAYFDNGYSDTYKMAKHIWLDTPNKKLNTLCHYFGIVNEEEHRALSDCRATGQLYLKLSEMIRDEQCSYCFAPVCGSKSAQSHINDFCHIGDQLEYKYNDDKDRYELSHNGYNVGYIPQPKVNYFKFNLPIMKAIEIDSINTVKDNKKALYVKVLLSEKQRREYVERFKLLSSKSIWQQNIVLLKIGDRVFFKMIEPEKVIFYSDERLTKEIGSVPKKVLKMFQNILDYSSKIIDISYNDKCKQIATVEIRYCKTERWN